jgi:hypothetical protein
VVHLKGLIKSGTALGAFILPVGYRPALPVGFATVNHDVYGLVNVLSDGTVQCFGGYSSQWLDQISFYAPSA